MRLSVKQPMTSAGSNGVVFILWEIEITNGHLAKYNGHGNKKIRKHGNTGKMEISRGGRSRATAIGARAGLTAYSDVITLRNVA